MKAPVRIPWVERYPDGSVWLEGEIGLIDKTSKHLYNYRTGFSGYVGKPVCRLGTWKRYFRNGQLAWSISYDEYGNHLKETFRSFRIDGTHIQY